MANLNNNESTIVESGKQYLINQIIAIRDKNLANTTLFESSSEYFFEQYSLAYTNFSSALKKDATELGEKGIGAIATLVLAFAPGILSKGLATFAKNNVFLKSKIFQTGKYEYGLNDINESVVGLVFKPKYAKIKVEMSGKFVEEISKTLASMGASKLAPEDRSSSAQENYLISLTTPIEAAKKYRDQVLNEMRSTWSGSAEFINKVNNSGTLPETLIDSYYREMGRIIPNDRRLNLDSEKRDFKKYLHKKVILELKKKIEKNIFVSYEPIDIKYLGITMEQDMWAHYILEQKMNPNSLEKALDLHVDSRFQKKDRHGHTQGRHFQEARMGGTYRAYGRHMIKRLLDFGVSQHSSETEYALDRNRSRVNSQAELRQYETWAQFTMDWRGPQFWGERGLKRVDMSAFWQEPN